MINFDDYTNENKSKHNSKWPYIPDHSYRILIMGGSGSRKANALLNLINNQPDTDKICMYAKDPYEAKYQHLSNKREKVGQDHFNDPKAFIEYSNDMQIVYRNIKCNSIEEYNPGKKRKILITFEDMIADMVFITQSYFKVPKEVILNTTHFFIMKITNKRELQQIALNQLMRC